MQAEALGGEVLADHRHAEVGAVLAAVRLGERVAVVAGVVGAAACLAQQRLPLLVGQAAAIPVGAGVLAAMVEEADVVVLLLERLDLPLDEVVELAEVGDQFGRYRVVHAGQRVTPDRRALPLTPTAFAAFPVVTSEHKSCRPRADRQMAGPPQEVDGADAGSGQSGQGEQHLLEAARLHDVLGQRVQAQQDDDGQRHVEQEGQADAEDHARPPPSPPQQRGEDDRHGDGEQPAEQQLDAPRPVLPHPRQRVTTVEEVDRRQPTEDHDGNRRDGDHEAPPPAAHQVRLRPRRGDGDRRPHQPPPEDARAELAHAVTEDAVGGHPVDGRAEVRRRLVLAEDHAVVDERRWEVLAGLRHQPREQLRRRREVAVERLQVDRDQERAKLRVDVADPPAQQEGLVAVLVEHALELDLRRRVGLAGVEERPGRSDRRVDPSDRDLARLALDDAATPGRRSPGAWPARHRAAHRAARPSSASLIGVGADVSSLIGAPSPQFGSDATTRGGRGRPSTARGGPSSAPCRWGCAGGPRRSRRSSGT